MIKRRKRWTPVSLTKTLQKPFYSLVNYIKDLIRTSFILFQGSTKTLTIIIEVFAHTSPIKVLEKTLTNPSKAINGIVPYPLPRPNKPLFIPC